MRAPMSRTTTWSSCGWRTTEAIGRAGGPAYGARCVLPHLHTAKESAQTLAIEPPPRECVHGKTLPMAQTRTIGLHQPIHGSLWLSQTQAALWWLGREAPTWPGAAFGLLCAWRALAGDRDLAKAIPSQSAARHSPPTTAAAARWHRRRLPTLCYFMCSPVPRLAGAPLGSRPAPWSSWAWPLAAWMPSHTSTRASSACPSSSRATSTWCGRAGGEARSSWRLPGSSVGHPEGQCSLFAHRAAAQPRNALPTVDSLVVGFQLGPAGHSRL